MNKNFNSFGVMIDMSRNSVMSVSALKRFLPLLAKMGYDTVMLYTEDTYEISGEPYFGYMRGKYTEDEMREIDDFAFSLGIEVIPCIQTLAHMNAAVRWGIFPVDCNDIMLTDDENTYAFIDKMFASLSRCFRSKRIHIGMDEAHMLGRGRHLDLHGYEDANTIIKRHLARVCDIAKKYDYSPMMWSDMFIRPWNGGAYYIPERKVPDAVASSVPDGLSLVYWDYYHDDEKVYDDMFGIHRRLSDNIVFAGGVWGWTGLVPHNATSIRNMLPAIRSCISNGVRNAFMTLWGDDGGEASHFSQLPALFYIAEYANGNEDDKIIKAKFRRLFGVDFDDFMALDIPNALRDDIRVQNPSKYMLYSDYFNGFLDYTVTHEDAKKYAEFAVRLHNAAKKTRTYGYLFDCEAKLCDVLSIKYDLGLSTREAYLRGDKDKLRSLAENEYREVEKRLRVFHAAAKKQWFQDNKASGFDVQDLRMGGILQRTVSCRKRIFDYVNGKIPKIEELEEKLLPYSKSIPAGTPVSVNDYKRYASPNVTGGFGV